MAGRSHLFGGEESPDSMEQRRRVIPGQGNLRESATENRLPPLGVEKVKRWGKSPPLWWQHQWHGKPRREQNQIGTARAQARGRFSPSRSGLVARAHR